MKEYIKPEITIENIWTDEDILTSSTIGIMGDGDDWLNMDEFGE